MAGVEFRNLSTILIFDDHPIVLFGARFVIERDGRFMVCGEAVDAEIARTSVKSLQSDYVIVDLVLCGRDGLGLVRDLARLTPCARILVYSSQNEGRYARRALRAEARDFVAKSDGLDVVIGALEIIAAGKIYISESLHNSLLEHFLDPKHETIVGQGDIFLIGKFRCCG